MKNAGIVAVETWLPGRVKTHSDWPVQTVERWRKRASDIFPTDEADTGREATAGVRRSMAAIHALRGDPFQGCEQIHVIADEDESSDLEVRAACLALTTAGLLPKDIDLLLTHAMVPDAQVTNPGAIVHHKLGLRTDATTFGVDSVCASFILQLQIASRHLKGGDGRYALLTQSSAVTRIMPPEASFTPIFGDGGAAAVVGELREGYGLLGVSTRTWGEMFRGFYATVPGNRWYDEGRVLAASDDKVSAKRVQLISLDLAEEIVSDVLKKTGVSKREISFFACHQPTCWFPRECREHLGLTHTAFNPTFATTGTLSNVNIPIQLSTGARNGQLKDGDLVLMISIAAGLTVTGAVMRWGGAVPTR